MNTNGHELDLGRWMLIAALILATGCDRESETAVSANTPVMDVANGVGFAPEAVTLAPGVHLLGKVVPGNAYAIETSAGLVLIDCGIHDDASFVIRQLEELNLDVDTLQAVFITHSHVDHFQGAAYLRERTGAKIHVGAGDAGVVAAGSDKEALFSKYTMTGLKLHPTKVDVVLEGGEVIEMGDSTISAIATPGHSPGSTSYLLNREGESMLFTGDTISSLTGELGTYITRLSPRFRGDAASYLETYLELSEMPVPDLVFPGHTEDDPLGQSPRMNARLWAELLGRGQSELRTIIDRFETDGRDFLADEPFRIHDQLCYLGRFRDQGLYAIATGRQFYLFDAPGGRGFTGTLAERLDALNISLPPERYVLFTNHDARTTANLRTLVDELGFQVIASEAAKVVLEKRFPGEDIFQAKIEMDGTEAVAIIPHLLSGPGQLSTAYECVVAGKNIMITGRMPVEPVEQSVNRLYRDLTRSGGDPADFLSSLDRLAEFSPDIWLPATIVNDQNANIYDTDWFELLRRNRELFEAMAAR